LSEATVVIPVYNQTFALALSLQGFTKQETPYHNVQIIVVDDGSTEPIEPVVESYKDQLNIKYVRLTRNGRAMARNNGAKEAQTGIVIFSDADRIPHPSFVREHVEAQRKTNGVFVVGQVCDIYIANAEQNRQNIMASYQNHRRTRIPQYCRLVYSLFASNGYSDTNIPWVAALSGNMSLPLDTFKKVGGFDEKFTEWGFEHFEFGYRIHLEKVPFYYASAATNVHIAHRRDVSKYRELIRKSHKYFYEKHPSFVVKKFLNFMLGEIGLTQLEHAVHSYVLPENDDPNHYVRITNF
jgi:GT2 family glycosyltransferase